MRDSTTHLLSKLALTDITAMDGHSPALSWKNVPGGEISTLTKYFEKQYNTDNLTAEDIFLAGLLLQIIAHRWPTSRKIDRLVIVLAKQQKVSLLDLANLKPNPDIVFKSSPYAILNATLSLMRELLKTNSQDYSNASNMRELLLIKKQAATSVEQLRAETGDSDDLESANIDPAQSDSPKSIRSNIIDVELELHAIMYKHDLLINWFSRINNELVNALGIIVDNSANINIKEYISFFLGYPLKRYLPNDAQAFLLCHVIVLASEVKDKQTFVQAMQAVLQALKSDIPTEEKETIILQLAQSLSNSQKIDFAKLLRDDLITAKADQNRAQYDIAALKLLYKHRFANHDRRHLEAQAKAFMRFTSSPRSSMSEDATTSRATTPSLDSLSGSQQVFLSAQVLNWIYGHTSGTEDEAMAILASYNFNDPATFNDISPEMQDKIKQLIMRITANSLAISRHERQADIISKHNVKCSNLDLERYIRDIMYHQNNSPVRLLLQDVSNQNAVHSVSALLCIRNRGNGFYEVYNPSAPYGSLQFIDTQSTLQSTRAALFGLQKHHCGLQEMTSYIRSLFPAGTTVLKVTHYTGYRQRPVSMHARAQTPTEGMTDKLSGRTPLVRVQSEAELKSLEQANLIREQVRNGMPVTDLLVRKNKDDYVDSPVTHPLGTPLLHAFLGDRPRAIPGEGTYPEHVEHLLEFDATSAKMPTLSLNPDF